MKLLGFNIKHLIFIVINLKVILKLFSVYLYYVQHPFWFYCDAIHNYKLEYYTFFNKGIINDNPRILYNKKILKWKVVEINNTNNNKTNNTKSLNNIVDFINENYSNQYSKYVYTNDYLNHICKWYKENNNNYESKKIYVIRSDIKHNDIKHNDIKHDIKNDNKINALGIGYKSKLSIDGIEYLSYYSDYLCVMQEYRGKGLFTALFAHALNKNLGSPNIEKVFIYKRDHRELPIKHFVKYHYYLIFNNIPKQYDERVHLIEDQHLSKIHRFNGNLYGDFPNKLYDYYTNYVKGKRVYNIYEKDEFIRYLNSEHIMIYAYIDKDIIKGVVCVVNTHIINIKYDKMVYEIVFSMGDLDIKRILEDKICNEYNSKYIIGNSINGNYDLYCKTNTKYSLSTCYYYLYNFNNDEYTNDDVFLLYF